MATSSVVEAPPGVPRPTTPLARRRAWTEPTVRVWWLIALGIVALIVAYVADRSWAWHTENKLITDGAPVTAKIIEANGQTVSTLKVEPNSPVTIEFDWHGKLQRPSGKLEDRKDFITVGQPVQIRVDPNDPSIWTTREQPAPLMQSLFVGLALLPIPPVLIAIAAIKRKHLLSTWQGGEAQLAVVLERNQTPIAPLSYTIRCSLREGRDKRVFTVFVPRAGASLHKNDLFWLILPRNKSGKPISAMWFE